MKPARESVAALLLLCLLCGGSLLALSHPRALAENFRSGYRDARPAEAALPDKLAAAAAGAEHAVNQALSRCTGLITVYGGIQRLIGNEIVQDVSQSNNVVRLKNGKLNFIARETAPGDPSENAGLLNDFSDYAQSLGVPVQFVLAPQKIAQDQAVKPAGAVEFGNENSDRFLSLLQGDPLDLRGVFQASARGHDAYFFNTDHHWTPEGAFLGFQAIAERLETAFGFAIDPALTDPANYRVTVYEHAFLGSQGKRVGPWYAGTDDFPLLLPAEPTDGYSFEIPHKGIVRTGSFEDAFLFYEMLHTGSLYQSNPYVVYTGGDYPLSITRNSGDTTGKRLLLIRQSFSCALAPFLARVCERMDILDPRYFQGSIREYVAETRPDLVLIVYAASDTCNDALFQPLADGAGTTEID